MDEFFITSKSKNEIVDITSKVEQAVAKAGVKDGIVVVYTPHATCAVLINENYDPNILLDITDALQEQIPEGKWRHDKIDNNAAAHIKASIIGPSQTVLLNNGKLALGKWQSIMLADFDGPRERRVFVEVVSK